MATDGRAPSRRAGAQGRAASSPTGARRAPGERRASPFEQTLDRRLSGRAPVELRPWRVAALGLLLVAAAFYVSPLRAFFMQQDRYQREVAVLNQAKARNAALQTQIARMKTKDYITRQARLQYQLVQPGMQAFVVKGLPKPEPAATADPTDQTAVKVPAMTLPDRLADLWRTLRE